MRINAIVAHFDPNGERSSNFKTLLRILRTYIQDAVVVSTGISKDDTDFAVQLGYAVVKRGNIGYDFMSYSVGFETLRGARRCNKILFCNDSFYISNEENFKATLGSIINSKFPAAFLSVSQQINRHGQSYLFAVDRSVFATRPFQQFMGSIRPQPTRLHVIYAYELGLASCLKGLDANFSSIFDSRHLAPKSGDVRRRGINPTHDYADEIEQKCGIVKYERLLKNPLLLSNSARLSEIMRLVTASSALPITRPVKDAPPAVVICHCHYEEVVGELISVLDRLPDGSNVHVTSSNPSVLSEFKIAWRRRNVSLEVLAVENKGRDVLPFLETLRVLKLDENIPILKIHGKRSLYSPLGETWRRDLLNDLIPSEVGVRTIINQFSNRPRLAMIGAHGSYVSDQGYWGSNRTRVSGFMTAAGVNPPTRGDLGFYAGTMFWIRSQCANEVLSRVDFDQFEIEGGQRDGTYGHVLERAIPMTLRSQGWTLLETNNERELSPATSADRKLIYF